MKKNTLIMILVLALTMIMAACGTKNNEDAAANNGVSSEASTEASQLTFTHKLGETTVSKNPERVVVFDFGILDSLDKMGVEVTGVPKANIPSYLSKYNDEKYENVGGLKEPDFEKISELDPDLIIVSTRQVDMYEELNEIAPTLYFEIDYANYMKSFTENMNILGQIYGKEDIVNAEISKISEMVQPVHDKTTDTGGSALVILANAGNISAYGPGSRFGVIHDVLGFKPADENIEVSTHGQNVSFEYILEKNPDYLFVVDRDAAIGTESSAKQTIENELVKQTNAYKNGKIIYLDPNYWYLSGGGLISVSEMIKSIEVSVE
ncbi:siderophore ABC transporter substrate-binding protein [Calidifontibacillus oryziterrae]|uniref:siderophore ABC transporter substrate-binding protein n=1 Tax=Calidifontibacillus oryziterrae TaxID=1191699 RepID=UPI0002DCC659|nr:siderophore ABC transporter substrate-binding protein [Calidifontibacillus oryziterrae]